VCVCVYVFVFVFLCDICLPMLTHIRPYITHTHAHTHVQIMHTYIHTHTHTHTYIHTHTLMLIVGLGNDYEEKDTKESGRHLSNGQNSRLSVSSNPSLSLSSVNMNKSSNNMNNNNINNNGNNNTNNNNNNNNNNINNKVQHPVQLPQELPLTHTQLVSDTIYLVDNGLTFHVCVGTAVPSHTLMELFGIRSVRDVVDAQQVCVCVCVCDLLC